MDSRKYSWRFWVIQRNPRKFTDWLLTSDIHGYRLYFTDPPTPAKLNRRSEMGTATLVMAATIVCVLGGFAGYQFANLICRN